MLMWVLVLDTSSAAAPAAVVEVDADAVRSAAESVTVNARAHGEALAVGIRRCLRETDLVAAEVQAVVAGLGPGPFTGLRVGLVTAAVFADVRGIPTYGVCSLD